MSTPNTAQRTLWWMLAAMLGLVMFLLNIIGQMYATVSLDVKENTRLTTKHEADIGYISDNIGYIVEKLDALLNEKVASY